MSRLETVIEQVKNARIGKSKPWIFNDKGKIKDNLIVGEVLDLLEEMKQYEINVSDKALINMYNIDWKKTNNGNTYNVSANISNHIDYKAIETKDYYLFLVKIHLCGDIRCNYSNYFVLKMDNLESFFELDSWIQSKTINDRYSADINLMSEIYAIYDYEKQKNIGEFYDIEIDDILKQINEQNN